MAVFSEIEDVEFIDEHLANVFIQSGEWLEKNYWAKVVDCVLHKDVSEKFTAWRLVCYYRQERT